MGFFRAKIIYNISEKGKFEKLKLLMSTNKHNDEDSLGMIILMYK